MGNTILKQIVLPAVIIVAGFAAVYGLSGFIDKNHPKLPDDFTDSDLSMNGSRLKGFAFGMEGLIADWYWFRALQYIGDKMVSRPDIKLDVEDLTAFNPRLLFPLLENATDLDPHFIEAYSYGAIVLPAIDKERAVAFASKGIANNPNEWRLYQHLGYIYWKLERYDKAAETYELGAAIPGSSTFMKLMAASMKFEGGSRSTARSVYRQMLAESAEEAVRITADRRLKELDWLDERDAIDAVLNDFRERYGRCANSFSEVASALFQVTLPEGRQFRIDARRRLVDPTDAPYVLDKENCRVKLDAENTKLRVQ
jgi:tetratricopeptide (TPR) repeat protein